MKRLGDPHLGRRFQNSVPLHRRGERERLVREQFVRELDPAGERLHVCMGDLFDQPFVDLDTIWLAATAYNQACANHPKTQFIVIRGNHDKSRDLTKISAFDLFHHMTYQANNIHVVEDYYQDGEYVFFGWDPVRTAEDIVRDAEFTGATIAFGHWDVDLRSHHHNLMPTKLLAEKGITKAYTGHIHLPTTFSRDGIDVTVTGSMQPYAHSEDATGEWYVSLTKAELAEVDPATLVNKCVKILLAPGEATDVELDCLQLKYERTAAPEETAVEVTMDGFDLNQTYSEVFDKYPIIEDVKGRIDTKWQTTFTSGD